MRHALESVLVLALSLLFGCAAQPDPWVSGRWIDLTHPFSADTIYWPTAEPFRLEPVFQGVTQKGYYYTANAYCAAEHGGTHIDAPIHFAAGAPTVDQIGLSKLMGPAVVIDVSAKALANRDYRVSVDDVINWEREHGRIPPHTIVLLRTGYDRYWPNPTNYLGTKERGPAALAQLHFPGLAPEAARWLAEDRRIEAVGLDTASIDYGQSALFESHRILAKARIPIFENITRLDQVPATGTRVIALPMKIGGGSGAPLRLIAWVP